MAQIVLFDIDDTLVVTDGRIRVTKPSGELLFLSAKEFTRYRPEPSDSLDFSEFNCLDRLLSGSIVARTTGILLDAYLDGQQIGIITARERSEQPIAFLEQRLGVQVAKEFVFAVNEKPRRFHGETIPEMKRMAIAHIVRSGFDRIVFYEDDETNLLLASQEASRLGAEFMGIHVDDSWREKLIGR